MGLDPYCKWCGFSLLFGGHDPCCPGPPEYVKVNIAFALDSGIEWRKVMRPYGGPLPKIKGFVIRYTDYGDTPYYDGRTK